MYKSDVRRAILKKRMFDMSFIQSKCYIESMRTKIKLR